MLTQLIERGNDALRRCRWPLLCAWSLFVCLLGPVAALAWLHAHRFAAAVIVVLLLAAWRRDLP